MSHRLREVGPRRLSKRAVTGALALAVGGALSLGATAAHAGTAAKRTHKPVVMHGYTCTKVAKKRHQIVVGTAGQVICGLHSGVKLMASGPGHVVLIAGPGQETLVGSSTPGADDTLIGGTGSDTLEAGNSGNQVIDAGTGPDTIDCGTGGSTVSVVGAGSGDTENSDCGGSNVSNPSLDIHGTVNTVASDGSTMNVTFTQAEDTFGAWLTANGNPTSVDIAITPSTTVQIDGGGTTLAPGDWVEVTANTSSTTLAGSTLTAVDVQAQPAGSTDQ